MLSKTLRFVVFFLLMSSAVAEDLFPVKLQLKWQHQFQFAGYYAAIEKGYYRDAGLEVSLVEAVPGKDPIKAVLDGEAEFGVGTSELVLNYHRDDPVLLLAVIMQHSPLAIAVLNQSGISNIHQVARQKIMIEPSSLELFAYLKSEGVDNSELTLVEHSHQTNDLIAGNVQAMSIYTTDETYDFASRGIEYSLFSPIMGGIDFYGDNLFTTQQLFRKNPDRVKAFREASLRGWQYAMNHPEEIIQLILSRYSQRKSAAHLRYEAEKMQELMQTNLVEVGYSNPGRWQHIASTYVKLGLLPGTIPLQGMMYQPNIERQNEELKQRQYYLVMALLVLLLFLFFYYRQYRVAHIRHKQIETLFVNAPVSLIEIDKYGTVKNWNEAAVQTFQYKTGEVMGKNLSDLIAPSISENSLKQLFLETIESNRVTRSENSNLTRNGDEIICDWTNVPFYTAQTGEQRIICAARDITKEKKLEQALYRSANYDELTQIPNRSLILVLLKEAIADARRDAKQLAVLFMDLNDFKQVNDSYGHLAGDEVLKQTAYRVRKELRANDLIGRLSGDEFLVVIKNHQHEQALQEIIAKIYHAVEQDIVYANTLLNISASIGYSVYPDDSQDIQELINLSDKAMYTVKSRRNLKHRP